MNANGRCRITSLLIVLPMLLNAQLSRQHDPVALKHWLAPLYWQSTQASAEEHTVAPAANATGLPANANPLVFVAMPPCRVVDTRTIGQGLTGAFGPPSLAAGAVRTFPVLSSTTCTIPAVAQAYSFEITVVPPGPLAYITAFPTGQSAPVAAITVESPQGFMASNTGIIPAGTNGSVDVYANNPTDVVIDINGYYAPLTALPGNNTALGVGALANNTTGGTNTAVGASALQNNTAGGANTATGYGALSANTTGSDNTASGNLALSANTTGTGNTAIGNFALLSNTTGSENTANGTVALQYNTTGAQNTATGYGALASNTTGSDNAASGFIALQNNTTGALNTASGAFALQSNTTGVQNTASGANALSANTTGALNTASGANALANNTTGRHNTASGSNALSANTTGGENTASGTEALNSNTTGGANTAMGQGALFYNTTGGGNTASGAGALSANTTGGANTASGAAALSGNTTGSNNIAIGPLAAFLVSGGNSKNIHIGSQGAASDSGTIRIGEPASQTSLFVAGVRGVTTSANDAIPVVIDSNGQLGTVSSSRRFKEDIHDMDTASSGLMRLRPVTFRYQKPFADGSKPIQYGLVAEEVAEVYPDLVARSADGQIETVKYQVLDSMLLNELQKEHQQVQQQAETIQRLENRLAALEEALRSGK